MMLFVTFYISYAFILMIFTSTFFPDLKALEHIKRASSRLDERQPLLAEQIERKESVSNSAEHQKRVCRFSFNCISYGELSHITFSIFSIV